MERQTWRVKCFHNAERRSRGAARGGSKPWGGKHVAWSFSRKVNIIERRNIKMLSFHCGDRGKNGMLHEKPIPIAQNTEKSGSLLNGA